MIARSAAVRRFARTRRRAPDRGRPPDDRRARRGPRGRRAAGPVRRAGHHRRRSRDGGHRRAARAHLRERRADAVARESSARAGCVAAVRLLRRREASSPPRSSWPSSKTCVTPVDAAFAAILTPEARQIALRSAIPDLTPPAAETLAGARRQSSGHRCAPSSMRVLEEAQRQEVRDTLLTDVRGSLADELSVRFGADQRALAAEILSPLIVANSTFDAAATERARTEAANLVAPVNVEHQQRRDHRPPRRPGRRLRTREARSLRPARAAAGRSARRGLVPPRRADGRAAAGLGLALPLADLAPQQRAAADRTAVDRRIARAQGHRRSIGPALRRADRGRGPATRRPARRGRRPDGHRHPGAARRRDHRQRRVLGLRPVRRRGRRHRHPPRREAWQLRPGGRRDGGRADRRRHPLHAARRPGLHRSIRARSERQSRPRSELPWLHSARS